MKIYNTLCRSKKDFIPLKQGHVSIYVCGVTVYDECHLGHARAYVVFDILRRYLKYKGYKVRYVQNFTDVDDKIIGKAQHLFDEDKDIFHASKDISECFIARYFEDMDALGILRADEYPKATEHIPEMIEMIQVLIDKGYAYVVDDREVFFAVNASESYGKLSGKKLEDLQAGQRVNVDTRKKNPLDFVLWKPSKSNEPKWASPWGEGRPGWHIECSAMAVKHLGETFDIHGGGADLVFPHHENEIAQAESCTDKCFARYWMHNGFLRSGEEKMSKSLGNTLTLKKLYEDYDPEVLRFFLLTSHYRSPMHLNNDSFDKVKEQCHRGYMMLKSAALFLTQKTEAITTDPMTKIKDKWLNGMDDDMNTSIAVSCLFEIVLQANLLMKSGHVADDKRGELQGWLEIFHEIASVLYVFQKPYIIIGEDTKVSDDFEKKLQDLLLQRKALRGQKDWKNADKVRDDLLSCQKDIELEDTSFGSFVVYKKN
ncbi:cysteine--tRNA ligase [PVC group bacterium (ex Bugula neritina AB1)]|nr:cysteine--tRNA ligase [PVC group bacterium (ex Bugula neritina AB1)]